ncbi:LCP family protein [Actinomadura viridis]|uniref:LCP family protein required for cell wall assembly n=1 Tax=Actinomadura viridis TaxID=58110 RepID=A0A931GGE0_9ACTN|nr:LCP family protein [Actinomadura viridis]MBG6086240.1 LCP family protein required for cell wall assembly [Actinomadura viridis]
MNPHDLPGSPQARRPGGHGDSGDPAAAPSGGLPGPGGHGSGDDGPGTAPGKAPRKRRGLRILAAVAVFVVLVAVGVAGLAWQRESSYNGNIDRLPGVMPSGKKRPGPSVTGTENWLLVGSDTRAEVGTTGSDGPVWKPGQQRSDTIMLLHLPADRSKAYVISFPRDSWVQIPGYGPQKINAAFSFGGPPLLIETVENLTGIRIDHFGAIDFNGFKSMTDALGGVEVDIKESVYDPARKVHWQAGRQRLDGEKALLFVRQRYNLPNGDFDRIRRQQAFLRALAQKAADGGTISNPIKLDRFLSAFTKSISVDDSVSAGKLRSLALSMRGVRPGDVSFMTVPHKGSAQRARQSVVLLDRTRSSALFEAVRTAEVAQYVQRYGGGSKVGTVS